MEGNSLTGGTPVTDLRFVIQASNGVGLVTMMTNEGAYYQAGVDPGAPVEGQNPVIPHSLMPRLQESMAVG